MWSENNDYHEIDRLAHQIDKAGLLMHMIINPGEYGLGTQPESIPFDDKKAWEKVGQFLEEIFTVNQTILNIVHFSSNHNCCTFQTGIEKSFL